jgi:hypothetical protein
MHKQCVVLCLKALQNHSGSAMYLSGALSGDPLAS